MKHTIEPIEGVKGYAVSVVKWNNNDYSIALLKEDGHSWKVVTDYENLNDLTAGSEMGVYGVIQHIIRPIFFN